MMTLLAYLLTGAQRKAYRRNAIAELAVVSLGMFATVAVALLLMNEYGIVLVAPISAVALALEVFDSVLYVRRPKKLLELFIAQKSEDSISTDDLHASSVSVCDTAIEYIGADMRKKTRVAIAIVLIAAGAASAVLSILCALKIITEIAPVLVMLFAASVAAVLLAQSGMYENKMMTVIREKRRAEFEKIMAGSGLPAERVAAIIYSNQTTNGSRVNRFLAGEAEREEYRANTKIVIVISAVFIVIFFIAILLLVYYKGDDKTETALTVAMIFIAIGLIAAVTLFSHFKNRSLFARNAAKLAEKRDDKRLALQRLYQSFSRKCLIVAAVLIVIGSVVGVIAGFYALDADPEYTAAENYLFTVLASVAIAFFAAVIIDLVLLVVYQRKACGIEKMIDEEEKANDIYE